MEEQELFDIALSPVQYGKLAEALREYDAPDMYWDGEDNEKSKRFRQETANEILGRMYRNIEREGSLRGIAVDMTEQEYKVCIEALVQFGENTSTDTADLIKHFQWFNKDGV